MNGILGKLFNFDEMIGAALVRVLYYIGLVGIAIYSLVMLGWALNMASYSPLLFIGGLFAAALTLVLGTLMWRFYCELFIMAFKIFDRLGEIRDRLPPAP